MFALLDGAWQPTASLAVVGDAGSTPEALVPFVGSGVYLAAADHRGAGQSALHIGLFIGVPLAVLAGMVLWGRRRTATVDAG